MKNREENKSEFSFTWGPISINRKSHRIKTSSEEPKIQVSSKIPVKRKQVTLWNRVKDSLFFILTIHTNYLKLNEPTKIMILENGKKVWMFLKSLLTYLF